MTEKLKSFKLLMVLATVIATAILKEVKKDGFQITDLFAFLASEEFKNQIGPAIQSLPEIKDEFKNFDGHSGFEVARIAVDMGEAIYTELSSK